MKHSKAHSLYPFRLMKKLADKVSTLTGGIPAGAFLALA